MPALFHLVLHGLLGSLLAWCSRSAPRAQARLLAWPLFFGLAYAVSVLLPLCAYQFRFYPDFSLSYAFDPVLYPWAETQVSWLCLAANTTYLAALVFGYATARAGLRRGRWLLALTVPILAATGSSWAVLQLGARNLALGDYTSFWRGTAQLWTTAPSGVLVALAYLTALVALRFMERRWRGRDPLVFGQL